LSEFVLYTLLNSALSSRHSTVSEDAGIEHPPRIVETTEYGE
jgi:hypothetical protein